MCESCEGKESGREKYMKKRVIYLLFVLLILAQTGELIYTFVCRKEGYHSDEIWSYGLANSYYQPFLTLRDGVFIEDWPKEEEINSNRWIPGSVFKEYITVQPEERFSYGSVYHNQTLDHHPPLFYFLLHTVCSFFPDQFSWWYGFSICVLCFAGTQIFLFLTTREITGSEAAALVACLFYGGGTGMLCTFAFVRQYSLLTMLCIGFTYFSVCLYHQTARSERFHKGTWAAAVVFAFMAFMTHYYAIVYIGVYTALFCVYLLLKRKIKRMFLYGGSILAALGGFVAIYPAALFQMIHTNKGYTKMFSTATQIRILFSLMFQYDFGFKTSYFATAFWNITLPLLAAFIVFGMMLLFPFRHETWFHAMIKKLKNSPKRIWNFVRGLDYTPVFIFAAAFSIYVLVAKITDVYKSGIFVMRYISLTFPLLCMLAIAAGHFVIGSVPRVRRWTAGILLMGTVIAVARVRLTAPYPYSFGHYGECQNIEETVNGKRVLVISSGRSSMLTVETCFALYLSEAKECFMTTAGDVRDCWREPEEGTVDYVIAEYDVFTLTQEEENRAKGWIPGGDDTEDNEESNDMSVSISRENEDESKQKDCTEFIREICGGRGCELKELLSIQGSVYYVLESEGRQK